MSRSARRASVVLLASALVVLLAMLRYPGKPPLELPAEQCDRELWRRVYRPERLEVVASCTAVEGRVVEVRHESDGDLHVEIDPSTPSVLNLWNAVRRGGRLVVEVVCHHESTHQDAQAACAGFHSRVEIPEPGDRIRAIGAYVTDREIGWKEIHPVTRIDRLR